MLPFLETLIRHYKNFWGDEADGRVHDGSVIEKETETTSFGQPVSGHSNAEMGVNREDALTLEIIIHMMNTYLDALDIKVGWNKQTFQQIFQIEQNMGRWEQISMVVTSLKKLSLQILLIDGIEQHFSDVSDDIKGIIRRADTYSILSSEEE